MNNTIQMVHANQFKTRKASLQKISDNGNSLKREIKLLESNR